eukprot:m.219832 g.219832  ORF g.219832 m.219832 type:complete len:65 (+) comp13826_c0_seq18:4198-4392(+)
MAVTNRTREETDGVSSNPSKFTKQTPLFRKCGFKTQDDHERREEADLFLYFDENVSSLCNINMT